MNVFPRLHKKSQIGNEGPHINHLGWAQESAFLPRSQVMLLLLILQANSIIALLVSLPGPAPQAPHFSYGHWFLPTLLIIVSLSCNSTSPNTSSAHTLVIFEMSKTNKQKDILFAFPVTYLRLRGAHRATPYPENRSFFFFVFHCLH